MPLRSLTSITLFFASGILLASLSAGFLWVALPLFLMTGAFATINHRKIWRDVLLMSALVLLGIVFFQIKNQFNPNDPSTLPQTFLTLRGSVASDVEIVNRANPAEPSLAQFTFSAVDASVSDEAHGIRDQNLPVSGRVLVHLSLKSPTDGSVLPFEKIPTYGEILTLHGQLQLLQQPRNPDGFNYREYYERLGIRSLLTVRRPDAMQIEAESDLEANPFLRVLYPFRRKLLHLPEAHLPPTEAAVLNGILWGEKAELSGGLHDAFNRTGVIHILATAGLHVGMLTLLLRRFFRLLRMPNRASILTIIALLVCYSALSGGRPAVSRAVLVACFYLFGQWMEREPRMLNALSFSALILLLIDPKNLFDAGFQLSFATTISIALLAPPLQTLLKQQFGFLNDLRPESEMTFREFGKSAIRGAYHIALLTFLAQIGSAPLIALRSHFITLVSFAANLAVVPIVFLVLGIGFPAVFLAQISPQLAHPLFEALRVLIDLILKIVVAGARLPFAVVSVGVFPLWVVAAYYGALWGGTILLRRKQSVTDSSWQ